MRPFTFSLQAVQTLRQRQEQLALEAFGECVRVRQAALEQQQLAERQLSVGLDQLTILQSGGAPLYHLNQLRGHCQLLEQRLEGCRTASSKAQESANKAWEALQDARRELELVDKLYLRRRDDYERELRSEEQKQLDEMSGRRSLFGTITLQPATLAWN
jgi:flagellar export protein FliJ